jgi:large subunit ribosomal protein L1
MGKIRTRTLGVEEVEKKQKKAQKVRSEEKKKVKSSSAKSKEEKIAAVPVKPTVEVKKVKEAVIKTKAHGKKYMEVKKLVDKSKSYSLVEAVKLVKKLKYAKFDESVELHLNVDKAGLRGEVELPFSTGKSFRVKIVSDAVLAEIEKGDLNFDILITHPSFMPKLAKYAKVLGPKGLMPNPKSGTISPQPEEVAKKFAKGTLRYKTEAKFPLIHQMIGKVSFEDKDLVANAEAFLKAVGYAHILQAFIKTTMSPSVKLNLVA